MTIFWILAAGLMGLALFFVAWPLLRPETPTSAPEQDELNLQVFNQRIRELDADLAAGSLDQSQYTAARRDLERDLLRDVQGDVAAAVRRPGRSEGRWLAFVLAVAVPAAAISLYLELGEREMIPHLEGTASGRGKTLASPAGQDLPPLEVLVERLEERLQQDPDNLEGWLMIGRTYFTMRQPERALEAVSKAYALAPERTDVTLAYAEAIAANSNNSLEGKPAQLIEQVLAIEPDNPSARWLSGMLYYQRGQFNAAATAWQRLLDEMDPDAPEVEDVRTMIAEARSRAGALPPGLPQATGDSPQAPAASPEDMGVDTAATAPSEGAPAVQGGEVIDPVGSETPQQDSGRSLTADVRLAEAILTRADPEDVVFVFARAVAGPPMPLAVQRLQVKDLPAVVTLNDSMAMTPAMSLSSFPQVMIGARISKSGQATPQSGDLEGEAGPIDVDQTAQIAVTIDRIRP
ncbi:MAG: c-type cytochrome biogenesis protein CcmI [Thiocapsa sp.]|jgi:cytochrome c-type biogenesis protein CcmH|nr:c-type cytochrome biogenesis protein CcmI [Thiocapsa sp.]MCG6896930.1 c-type cytochrome biogenesis protein CcmI [Thiocapsa sp.]MCG6986047.1 c-type cytochrome biogenesis protein CcmI [Thiocapsa sp.]